MFVGSASSSQDIPIRTKSFSGVTEPLPKNVMLITKKPLYERPEAKSYLVRLGHQYGLGEDPDLSLPVKVDLSILFPGQRIQDFHETTLSGNRAIEDWRRERLDWSGSSEDRQSSDYARRSIENETIITLTPMDIRTFIVNIGN